MQRNIIAIGWRDMGDVTKVRSREEMLERARLASPDESKQRLVNGASQMFRFMNSMSAGDTVLVYDPSTRKYHAGTVAGSPEYHPELIADLPTTRTVRWTAALERDTLSVSTRNSLGAILTLFAVTGDAQLEIEGRLSGKPPEDLPSDASDEAELLDDIESKARQLVEDKIDRLKWDQLQELVAGVLRAMGYKTRVSPPGPDRGRDVVASPDGFGFEPPRIVAEVKHRKEAMGSNDIRSFTGGLRGLDKGLYVSTGGFTKEAKYEAERSDKPITLMDLSELAGSVIEYYDLLDARTKAMLPLTKVYWPT